MNLQGKTVLVTGGVRRLGLAMAEAVASRGAKVALHYRSSTNEAEAVMHLIRQSGAEVAAFQADLLQTDQITSLISQVVARFGTLDVLINNAALFERKPLLELTEDDWDQTLNTNLKAPFWCSRMAAEVMLRQGSGKIINMACIGGLRPWANYIPYCVSKAGLIMLTETLARALKPKIQVNAIAPGMIEFNDQSSQFEVEPSNRRTIKKDFQKLPTETNLPRGNPADITRALLYLLDSDFVTGETLVVDGGRILL